MSNIVPYNEMLQFLHKVFDDLNLKINNITRIEIAVDSYKDNPEQIIRRGYRNKENLLKILGRNIKDRKAKLSNVAFWNAGSPDNPFQDRTMYIRNNRYVKYYKKPEDEEGSETTKKTAERKTTFELIAYNKLEEIKDVSSHKAYIQDYHKSHNLKYKYIFRLEFRAEYEEIQRYQSKIKKLIGWTELLDKQFLYEMFTEYIDR